MLTLLRHKRENYDKNERRRPCKLRATNEWANLKKVVVGTAQSMGGTPALERLTTPSPRNTLPQAPSRRKPTASGIGRLGGPAARHGRGGGASPGGAQFEPNLRPRRGHRGGGPLVATRMIADRADEWHGVAPLLANVPASTSFAPCGRARRRRRRDAQTASFGWATARRTTLRHSPRRGPTKPPWIGCRTNSRIGTFGVSTAEVGHRPQGQCASFGLLPQHVGRRSRRVSP